LVCVAWSVLSHDRTCRGNRTSVSSPSDRLASEDSRRNFPFFSVQVASDMSPSAPLGDFSSLPSSGHTGSIAFFFGDPESFLFPSPGGLSFHSVPLLTSTKARSPGPFLLPRAIELPLSCLFHYSVRCPLCSEGWRRRALCDVGLVVRLTAHRPFRFWAVFLASRSAILTFRFWSTKRSC